jgi:hypothetical protein
VSAVEHRVRIAGPRPYFAEFAYALWGDVNYDSEGDCRRPTDRAWTWLEVTNRKTGAEVVITSDGEAFTVRSDDAELAARAAWFLRARTNGEWIDAAPPESDIDGDAMLARSQRVRDEFPRPELAPLDCDAFWGSWKWVGPSASELTWVGRWIMCSLLTRDPRPVAMTIEWLADGTYDESQSVGLRHALALLTGKSFATDAEWVRWYRDGGGAARFPEPNYDDWYEDLKNAGPARA